MKDIASEILQSLGGNPLGFVDIGARGEVHPLVDPIAAAVAVLGFEPDAEECRRMLDTVSLHERYAKFELEAVALSDRAGPATLYEISAPTNSSLLPPNPVFVERYDMQKWQVVKESELNTLSLDDVLFSRRASDVYGGEALKIDTQGTEFEILTGAKRTLTERTQFLCVEVSFCELYKGQRLFSDVEQFLRGYGFSFYGFDRTYNRSRKKLDKSRYWGRERPIQADAYFFKDPYDPAHKGRRIPERNRIILAAFAVMTSYHDFALELLQDASSDTTALRDAVLAAALLSPDADSSATRDLAAAVAARPHHANVLVGKFVDQRRGRNDFFDVSAV